MAKPIIIIIEIIITIFMESVQFSSVVKATETAAPAVVWLQWTTSEQLYEVLG